MSVVNTVISPATEEVITEFPVADTATAEQAIARAVAKTAV